MSSEPVSVSTVIAGAIFGVLLGVVVARVFALAPQPPSGTHPACICSCSVVTPPPALVVPAPPQGP